MLTSVTGGTDFARVAGLYRAGCSSGSGFGPRGEAIVGHGGAGHNGEQDGAGHRSAAVGYSEQIGQAQSAKKRRIMPSKRRTAGAR
jgi:hypothetical protein